MKYAEKIVRSYLVYEGANGLYVEIGLCDAVPRKGDVVEIDGKPFVARSVTWSIVTKDWTPLHIPGDDYPQQCATVTLARRRKRKP